MRSQQDKSVVNFIAQVGVAFYAFLIGICVMGYAGIALILLVITCPISVGLFIPTMLSYWFVDQDAVVAENATADEAEYAEWLKADDPREAAGLDSFEFSRHGVAYSVTHSDMIAMSHDQNVVEARLKTSKSQAWRTCRGRDDDFRMIFIDRDINAPFYVRVQRNGSHDASHNRSHANDPRYASAFGYISEYRPIWDEAALLDLLYEIDPSKLGVIETSTLNYHGAFSVRDENRQLAMATA